LPPETIAPVSAKTIGLSVAALLSIATVRRTNESASRAAPWTWAAHRIEYASWTRPQSACEALMGLPARSRAMFAADARCPSNGRAS
jgi:hypothetical protein